MGVFYCTGVVKSSFVVFCGTVVTPITTNFGLIFLKKRVAFAEFYVESCFLEF